jgi:hypothetical protein
VNSHYWSAPVAIEQTCGKYNVIFYSVVSFVSENLEMIILGAHTWKEMQVVEDIAGELPLTLIPRRSNGIYLMCLKIKRYVLVNLPKLYHPNFSVTT